MSGLRGVSRPDHARPGRFRRRAVLALALVLAAGGCEWQEPPIAWSFERMIRQPSFRAYERAGFFADSLAMRQPPAGTVSRTAPLGDVAVLTGRLGTLEDSVVAPDTAASAFDRRLPPFVDEIPVRLTIDDVRHGQDRFRIFCAVCHGIDGGSGTPVARNMALRTPPSLLSEKLRGAPDGRIFAVITEGYGFMPSYAAELDVRERWAVVAYVRALQLARRGRLAELPDSLQRAFRAAVPGPGPKTGAASPAPRDTTREDR